MTWEEPPARDPVDWAEIGRELMTRPGQFKIVATYRSANAAAQIAYQIRQGKRTGLSALGRFAAEAHTVDGEHRVYALYLGEHR